MGREGRRWLYRLGPASTLAQPRPLEQLIAGAGDVLSDCADQAQATALLVVREADTLRHAAKCMHPHGAAMRDVGSIRTTWLTHPWGWAIAATLPDNEQHDLLAPEGATTLPADIAHHIRQHGWCWSDSDSSQRMAAPITDSSGVAVAALCLGGTLGEQRRRVLGPMLCRFAAVLPQRLAPV